MPEFSSGRLLLFLADSVGQTCSKATKKLKLRHFVHPTPLKFLKRDGVYYLMAKKKRGPQVHRICLDYSPAPFAKGQRF